MCHGVIREHQAWCNEVTGCFHEPPCVFEDVLALVHPGSWNPRDNFQQKKAQIFGQQLDIFQPCCTHKRTCPVPMVDYDFSGLPCTDNSRVKRGRQFTEGPTGPVFIVWALRLRVYGVLLAVLENVPEAGLNQNVLSMVSFHFPHRTPALNCPGLGSPDLVGAAQRRL